MERRRVQQRDDGWWWSDDGADGPDDWQRWGWPWACGGLVLADVWVVDLALWWFGWWPA